MKQRLQTYQDEREKDLKEINALNATLSAYMNRPSTPPPAPEFKPEYLMESLEDHLQQSVRFGLQKKVEELRTSIQIMLVTQTKETYGPLWDKLTLVLRMVNAISERVEVEELEDVTPSAATAAAH